MIPLLVIPILALLPACTPSAALTPTLPPATPTLIPEPATPSPSIPSNQAFVNEIYHRLEVDDTIPATGRLATISLFSGHPTAFFPDNTGLVLVYEVPTVAPSQEETTQAAVMLVGTAVGVAADFGITLSGVEVIFYAGAEPFIGFRARPPWGLKDVEGAPIAEELKEAIEENQGTPQPKPTLPLSGG
jgi:hypothetical protein